MWFSRYFIEFILIGFVGWIWEIVYNLIHERKWVRRGFLYGPICPIYGVATLLGLGILYLCRLNGHNVKWWQIALASFIGSAFLEYITAFVLEKLFHKRWWNYSDLKFHYQGRICIFASGAFAVAGLFIAYVFHPLCDQLFAMLAPVWTQWLAVVFLVVFIIDIIATLWTLTHQEKNTHNR